MGKGKISQLPIWMTQRDFCAWGIQTGPLLIGFLVNRRRCNLGCKSVLDPGQWVLSRPRAIFHCPFASQPINVIITPVPSGQRKLYCPQATLFHLRSALSCLQTASTYGLRHPSGRIMHSSGGIMWPSGSIISIVLRARL